MTEVVRGKRGRPKVESDESRREKIIVQAEKLFLNQGFVGTTMDEIAAKCRMSKQTLYRLFPSKIDLIAASISRHRFSLISLSDDLDDMPLDEAIAHIFRADISSDEDDARMSFLNYVWRESSQIPELGHLIFEYGAGPSQKDLADWLARQNDRGRIAICDPIEAARMLMDLIFGALFQKALGDHAWPGCDDRQSYVRKCARLFLYGVARPGTEGQGPARENKS